MTRACLRSFLVVLLVLLAMPAALVAEIVATPKDNLQEVFARADKSREDVLLTAGEYGVKEPLKTNSTIRAERGVALRWQGSPAKKDAPQQFILSLSSEGGGWGSPAIDGRLLLDCAGKIGGLSIDDVHDVKVSGVYIHNSAGCGLSVTRAWFLHLATIRVAYGTGAAIRVDGLSNGSMKGIVVGDHKAGVDVLMTINAGAARLENICAERCSSDRAILDLVASTSTLSQWSSENLEAPVLIRLHDSRMPTLQDLSFWQPEGLPSQIEVLVERCIEPRVDGLSTYNCRDAALRFSGCVNPRHSRVVRYYDTIGKPEYGVRPKYLVDVRPL